MNRVTLELFINDLRGIFAYGNDTEVADLGHLLVNGGNDVALSIAEIADAINDRNDAAMVAFSTYLENRRNSK